MTLELPNIPETSYNELKEKQDQKGILHIARIPPGMNPAFVKKYFEDFGIKRVYFVPEDEEYRKKRVQHGGTSKRRYTEGWMEFLDKQMAKKVCGLFSGKPVGGKKRHNNFHDDLWMLKYLSGFKWEHLTEKFLYERKMREHRLKAELAQAKKEVEFVQDKVEWSKRLQKRNENQEKSSEKEEEKLPENTSENPTKEEPRIKLLKKRLRTFKQRLPVKIAKEIVEENK